MSDERVMLDDLWKRFIRFRDENEYRFPVPESRSGLPISPGGGVGGEKLSKYLNEFFEEVLRPALGASVNCQFLNLLLWDPFRPDSTDNWALLSDGINNLGSKYTDYMNEIERRNLSMFSLLYNSLRKTVLELKIPKGGLPESVTSYRKIIPRGDRERWQVAKKQFRQLVRVHGYFGSEDQDVFIYYVPSLFNPKSPGTGIGGLILISYQEIRNTTLVKVQTILDSVLSKIGVHYLYQFFYDQSLRSAVSAIMTRNMSHNIGSHVTPRATVHAVRRRLEELGLWPDDAEEGLTIISELKGNLDEYTQRKADFLAEITTQPLMTTRPAFFYREVILPLVENSLMMDNIAANEGMNFTRGGGETPGGIFNRLQIRVRINGQHLKAVYRCKSCLGDEGEFVYPTALPYSLTCPYHKSERLQIDTIENGEHDVEVELPGPLGEFALYSFLENYIRNVAKHNKDVLGPGRKLKLTIDIDEVEGSERQPDRPADRSARTPAHHAPSRSYALLSQEQRDYYRIRVWDDVVDPDRPAVGGGDGTPPVPLYKAIADYTEASIIQRDGSLKRQAWGLGEMKICTVLLSGPRNFVDAVEGRKLLVLKETVDKRPRMVYEFRLMKSKKICAILPAWSNERMRLMLRDKGIWIYQSMAHLEQEMNDADTISSFHFALFDCSESAGAERENILHTAENRLSHFPFRVLAFAGNSPLPGDISNLVQAVPGTFHHSPLAALQEHRDADFAAASMHRWAWDQWMGRFLEKEANPKTAVVNVFFDQWEDEQPTKRWGQHAEKFNSYSHNVKLRVWRKFEQDKIGSLTKIPPLTNVPVHVFYDRHAKLKDSFTTYLNTNEDWSYVLLDKHSPDFTTLFTPRFPSLAPRGRRSGEEVWTLPWEMAEAGLLRVLVIDERAAEFSLEDLEHSAAEALLGLLRASKLGDLPPDFRPVKWHLAWAAKVYICTHFGINQEPQPLHERIASREGDIPRLGLRVNIDVPREAGGGRQRAGSQVAFDLSIAGGRERKLKADAILIHQGVLDEWRNRLGRRGTFNQDVFLANLRRHFPFVVVESGRGIPVSLSDTAKFLPFSLLQHSVLGNIVGKFGLSRVLMPLARRGREDYD